MVEDNRLLQYAADADANANATAKPDCNNTLDDEKVPGKELPPPQL